MASPRPSTIFPATGLDRATVRWEEHLTTLTPVQLRGELHFKREDYFAPLGYGGINGSKLRQCIWLIHRYVRAGGRAGIVSGASVKSPQLCMGSAVAAHYGLQSLHVIGGTRPETAGRHPNVALASAFGARFVIQNVGYNPALQRTVTRLLEDEPAFADYFHLEYGIGLDHRTHPARDVEAFHAIGARQVANIPDSINTLIIPTGSANSAVSILYGLAIFRPPGLRRVVLIGIGPNRLRQIEERLELIERVSGTPTRQYVRDWRDSPDLERSYVPARDAWYTLEHHDLHSTGWVSYQDRVPFHYHGILFHPTYEGKVMKYLHQRLPELIRPETLVWIVGGEPTVDAMRAWLPETDADALTVEEYGA